MFDDLKDDQLKISAQFESESEAETYIARLKYALTDWAKNWEGFGEAAQENGEIVAEYDLGNIKYCVGQWGIYVLLRFSKIPFSGEYVAWDFTKDGGLAVEIAYSEKELIYSSNIGREYSYENHKVVFPDFKSVPGKKCFLECGSEQEATEYIERLNKTMLWWSKALKKESEDLKEPKPDISPASIFEVFEV